jgi:ubiquinone/menaquinone biosynthesis C-methylase UbiE
MGDVEASFDRSWEHRSESHYNHWVRGKPQNQIQFAFRRHWLTFQRYLENLPGNSVLEVGCGRGTISSYFADAGYRVTLLDSSPTAIDLARSIYQANGHSASFVVGDAFKLSFASDSFGVCVSIGLLEHFDDVAGLMREQIRVLQPGGVMLAYVVPDQPESVQQHFQWLNKSLGFLALRREDSGQNRYQKEPLYRNGLSADAYGLELLRMGIDELETFGMYCLPMISHSPEFQFSLLPAPLERALVFGFSGVLGLRRVVLRRDPWRCRETLGQAFLVMARKPK